MLALYTVYLMARYLSCLHCFVFHLVPCMIFAGSLMEMFKHLNKQLIVRAISIMLMAYFSSVIASRAAIHGATRQLQQSLQLM